MTRDTLNYNFGSKYRYFVSGNTLTQMNLVRPVYCGYHPIWPPKWITIWIVLASLVVEAGDSVLCWPEGLGLDTWAGRSMWCGVWGLSLTTH